MPGSLVNFNRYVERPSKRKFLLDQVTADPAGHASSISWLDDDIIIFASDRHSNVLGFWIVNRDGSHLAALEMK
jgi:hypothetical protein